MTDHVGVHGHDPDEEDALLPPQDGGHDEHHPGPGQDQVQPLHAPTVALYTAVYGRSDWVKPAPKVPDGVPCYFYTDSPVVGLEAESLGWQARVVPHYIATVKGEPKITAPMLAHKFWKTHPALACPDVDVSLWIDGSMEVTTDRYVDLGLEALGSDDWACIPHPARGCIYPEGEYSATLTWRYDGPSILAQIKFYSQFHPPGWGLIATGANVRRHTPKVLELSHAWWIECLQWSHQDQLSLPVLLRLAEGDVKWNMNLRSHQDWILHDHGPGR